MDRSRVVARHSTTPHCNVRHTFPEIETIYRPYQVLLLNSRFARAVKLKLGGGSRRHN